MQLETMEVVARVNIKRYVYPIRERIIPSASGNYHWNTYIPLYGNYNPANDYALSIAGHEWALCLRQNVLVSWKYKLPNADLVMRPE